MKKKLLSTVLLISVVASTPNAWSFSAFTDKRMTVETNEESIARSTLTYMISRYREAKAMASNEAEISFACTGEVFKDFANSYISVIERERLQVSLINNYEETKKLVTLHNSDVRMVYPMIRENLIATLRLNLQTMRKEGSVSAIPSMTIENHGAIEYQSNLNKCNEPAFLSLIANQAPISGDFETVVESDSLVVPRIDGNDDFGDIIGVAPTNDNPGQIVKVEKSINEWLYDILKR